MHMPLYLWYHIHTWALILPLSDFRKHVRQTIIWDHPNQSPQHTAWVWNISWTYVTPGKGLSLGGLAPRFAEERSLKCRCAIHCIQTWGKVDQALIWFCRLIPENLRGRNKVSICKCHELEIIWNYMRMPKNLDNAANFAWISSLFFCNSCKSVPWQYTGAISIYIAVYVETHISNRNITETL